jgi:serine/threonine protein kinase
MCQFIPGHPRGKDHFQVADEEHRTLQAGAQCSARDQIRTQNGCHSGGKKKRVRDQEIAIMKMMDHPNIIKLYESFEDIRTGHDLDLQHADIIRYHYLVIHLLPSFW